MISWFSDLSMLSSSTLIVHVDLHCLSSIDVREFEMFSFVDIGKVGFYEQCRFGCFFVEGFRDF